MGKCVKEIWTKSRFFPFVPDAVEGMGNSISFFYNDRIS